MAIYPDISHYHPITNWAKIKATCPFLISKATQGTSFVDSTLNSFVQNCEKNKIPYWLYVYLNKGNEKVQAEFMVKTCKSIVGNYFRGYILDVEAKNDASNVKSALDYLNSLGGKTMIYTMYADYHKYKSIINGRPANCAWWEARYGKNDGTYSSNYPCHSGVDLHQYTDQGSVSGMTGAIDLNRLTGAKPEPWFTGKITKPVIKKTLAHDFKVGKTYTTQCRLYIRSSAKRGTLNIKKKKSIAWSTRKNLCLGIKARLKRDTKVTCKEIKRGNDGSIFVRIPSGWVLAYNVKTKKKNLL